MSLQVPLIASDGLSSSKSDWSSFHTPGLVMKKVLLTNCLHMLFWYVLVAMVSVLQRVTGVHSILQGWRWRKSFWLIVSICCSHDTSLKMHSFSFICRHDHLDDVDWTLIQLLDDSVASVKLASMPLQDQEIKICYKTNCSIHVST